MVELTQLQARRDLLEMRLVPLETAFARQQPCPVDMDGVQQKTGDLTVSIEALLKRLRAVNARLSELRGRAGSTWLPAHEPSYRAG